MLRNNQGRRQKISRRANKKRPKIGEKRT